MLTPPSTSRPPTSCVEVGSVPRNAANQHGEHRNEIQEDGSTRRSQACDADTPEQIGQHRTADHHDGHRNGSFAIERAHVGSAIERDSDQQDGACRHDPAGIGDGRTLRHVTAHEDVVHRPAQDPRQHQQIALRKTQRLQLVHIALRDDHRHADQRQRQRHQMPGRQPLAQKRHCQQGGQQGIGRHDERGAVGRGGIEAHRRKTG